MSTNSNNRDGHHAGRLITGTQRWQRIGRSLQLFIWNMHESTWSVLLHLRCWQQLCSKAYNARYVRLVNIFLQLAKIHIRWGDDICCEEHTQVSTWNSDRLQKELLLCDWFQRTYSREDYIVRYILIVAVDFFIIPQIVDLFSGTITRFAGSGKQGSSDGVGANASFYGPRGITVDQQTGNVFLSDNSGHLIRKITPLGVNKYISLVLLTDDCMKEKSQHSPGRNEASPMEKAKMQGFILPMEYALMKAVSRCSSVIPATTNFEGCNSMVRRLPLWPSSATTLFPFLSIHAGDVSTVCEIEQPTFVAVAANDTILVSTNKNILYKVTHQGIPTELTQHKHSLN